MTENEAIKSLELCKESRIFIPNNIVLDMAIKALEEIQQYRAIGTVEEVAEMSNSYINYFHKVRKYQAIGTVEEFEALKENNEEVLLKDGQLLYQQGLVDGYAKAIDEFANKLKQEIAIEIAHNDLAKECKKCGVWRINDIDKIAEQMKAGD